MKKSVKAAKAVNGKKRVDEFPHLGRLDDISRARGCKNVGELLNQVMREKQRRENKPEWITTEIPRDLMNKYEQMAKRLGVTVEYLLGRAFGCGLERVFKIKGASKQAFEVKIM